MPGSSAKERVLELSGVLSVHRVSSLKKKLLKELAEARPEAVDLSKVEWVDTAGLQLLLALVRECGSGVVLRGMNPDVANCMRVAGIDRVLEEWGNRVIVS